jgi:PAS domain S-box-containing protein
MAKVESPPSEEAEARSLTRESPLVRALACGESQRVGWFRLYFDDERWEWSPEVERMHGYEPGTVQPTTALVLSHKHPEDYERVAATLDEIRRTRQPFSARHRIIDVHGSTREVVVVAGHLRDDAGVSIGTEGFYVDVTRSTVEEQVTITEAVAEITKHRSTIEQAKGVLMVVYGIDADAAFELLKWRSQESNLKLRVLAEHLMSQFQLLRYDKAPPRRSSFDHILMTVDESVPNTHESHPNVR